MLFVYNTLQVIFLVIFTPVLLFVVLVKDKYRKRISHRLGFGLPSALSSENRKNKTTFWIHALSVGEVTSAVPLVKGIRKEMEQVFIVFSASTTSGERLAKQLLSDHVDCVIRSPLDILPIVRLFINRIQADLYLQVETDFWPNLLFSLHKKKTPLILVNGRISKKSMRSYLRFALFFKPLFNTFDALCMQTQTDQLNMLQLGINNDKIYHLGNLKYDTFISKQNVNHQIMDGLDSFHLLLVCGSTHRGEEQLLFPIFQKLKKTYPELFLVLAPRNIDRSNEILQIGKSFGMTGNCRSKNEIYDADYYLLDTIGELTHFYQIADIAFIGGTLVDEGGHNPIEAAIAKIPVLFGENMDDFEEISNSLVGAGGAFRVKDEHELYQTLNSLLQSAEKRKSAGLNGFKAVQQQKGVIHRHIELIKAHL